MNKTRSSRKRKKSLKKTKFFYLKKIMKNMIVNFNNRLNQAEEITCELEDRSLAIIQRRKKKLE